MEKPYSAAVLARVAAAASGFRNGEELYFIVNNKLPRKAWSAKTEAEAEAKRNELAASTKTPVEEWTSIGPCLTPKDQMGPNKGTWDKVVITGNRADGTPFTRTFMASENKMDALFFNLSAMDKFVFPYYTALYGPQAAAEMREAYLDEPCIPACHDPISDDCSCD